MIEIEIDGEFALGIVQLRRVDRKEQAALQGPVGLAIFPHSDGPFLDTAELQVAVDPVMMELASVDENCRPAPPNRPELDRLMACQLAVRDRWMRYESAKAKAVLEIRDDPVAKRAACEEWQGATRRLDQLPLKFRIWVGNPLARPRTSMSARTGRVAGCASGGRICSRQYRPGSGNQVSKSIRPPGITVGS